MKVKPSKLSGVYLRPREALDTLFLQGILKIASAGKGLVLSYPHGKGGVGTEAGSQGEREGVERGLWPGSWGLKLHLDAMGPEQVNSPGPASVPFWGKGNGLPGISPLTSHLAHSIWVLPSVTTISTLWGECGD